MIRILANVRQKNIIQFTRLSTTPVPLKRNNRRETSAEKHKIKVEEEKLFAAQSLFLDYKNTFKLLDVRKVTKSQGKKKTVQYEYENSPIDPPSDDFIESNSGVFVLDDFKERYELLFKPVWNQIDSLGGGWTDKNIQNLIINWDGDEYPLGDVAEIVVSGNKVAVSVAGMSDLVSPILVTCRKHNLVASDKNDLITIKLPPVTTAVKKKAIKEANESFKRFKTNFDSLLNQELKQILSSALEEDELEGFSTHTDIIEWIVQFQVMMMTHHEDTIIRAENLLKQREKSMLK